MLVLVLGLARAGFHQVGLGGLHRPHEPVQPLHLAHPLVGRLHRAMSRAKIYISSGQGAADLRFQKGFL